MREEGGAGGGEVGGRQKVARSTAYAMTVLREETKL